MIKLYHSEAIFSARHVPSWLLFAFSAGAVNASALYACNTFVTHVTGTVTRLGAEIARVFRLRLAIMAGSMLFFNLVATPLFNLIGPTHTEFYLGLLLLALGLGGYVYYRRQENYP